MSKRKYRPEHFSDTLADGRKAKFHKMIHQEYADCRFSAGVIEGVPPEDVYFMTERPYQEPRITIMRRDEAVAMIWCVSGALWSHEMEDIDGKGQHKEKQA